MKEIDLTKIYDRALYVDTGAVRRGKSGIWHNARAARGRFRWRIRDAFNVLIGRADALYWTIDLDK
jgi:hypothetical protein